MTDKPIGELVHPAGTIILCKDGCEIAEVIKDLHRGDIGYSHAVGNWRLGQRIAERGDALPLLCKCGAPYTAGFCARFLNTK